MVERLHIIEVGHRGDGVAQTPGGALFVPYTLPGETADAERLSVRPRAISCELSKRRRTRIEPVLSAFRHLRRLRDPALARARLPSLETRSRRLSAGAGGHRIQRSVILIDAHGDGRRRAVLHARRGNKDIVEVGFSAPRAHVIVPIDRCPVLAPSMKGTIEIAWKITEALKPAGEAARHSCHRNDQRPRYRCPRLRADRYQACYCPDIGCSNRRHRAHHASWRTSSR